jgi:hypothetical protein
MNDDAVSTAVRLWINDESGASVLYPSKVFLDSDTPFKAYLGAFNQDSSAGLAGKFKGFIYSVFLYNTS